MLEYRSHSMVTLPRASHQANMNGLPRTMLNSMTCLSENKNSALICVKAPYHYRWLRSSALAVFVDFLPDLFVDGITGGD